MAATVKIHYLQSGDQMHVACGRDVATVPFHLDFNRPMAHASGRLMTAGEKIGHAKKTVTCTPCRKNAGLNA